MAAIKKVNTATLIRGELYTVRHPEDTPKNPKEAFRFKRNVPVVIEDPRILAKLEDEVDETEDGDGEIYEKPRFRIDRGVTAPDDETLRGRTRLSASRSVKSRPRKRMM